MSPRPPAAPARALPAPKRRLPLFEAALAASLGAHALLFAALSGFERVPMAPPPTIEVDLSAYAPVRLRKPGDARLPGAPKGAPAPGPKKVLPSAAPAPLVPAPPVKAPVVPEVEGPKPNSQPEKAWVLPSESTRKTEKPVLSEGAAVMPPIATEPGGKGPGGMNGKGGTGGGPGTGDALVNRRARLLNGDDIRAMLRRFYPETERRAGREGAAVVGVAVGTDGKVTSVVVLQSAGSSAFDSAAKSVAGKMLFEPALKASAPAPDKLKVPVIFKLSD